jgi:hypothetical protein
LNINNPHHQAIHRYAEEQTNWTLISIAVMMVLIMISLSSQQTVQVSRLQTEVLWMQDKWDLGKKGYLKIHVAINIKTKEILALEVIDEKVHMIVK